MRPATLDALGCDAAPAAFMECTSAYLGVAQHSAAHRELLPRANRCAMDRGCLYPADARGNANQRRDQSVLNAALCALEGTGPRFSCRAEREFWMWAGQRALEPTADAGAWNDLVLFSRRGQGAAYAPRDAEECVGDGVS